MKRAIKLIQVAGLLITLAAAVWFFVALVGFDADAPTSDSGAMSMFFAIILGAAGIFIWLAGRAVDWWWRD